MGNEIIIEQIKNEITDIQTEFILKVVKLCDRYNINKTRYIRETIDALYKFSQITDFDNFSYTE